MIINKTPHDINKAVAMGGRGICTKCGTQENSCTQPTDTQHIRAAVILAQNYMAPFSYGSDIRQVMEGFVVWLDEQQQHV